MDTKEPYEYKKCRVDVFDAETYRYAFSSATFVDAIQEARAQKLNKIRVMHRSVGSVILRPPDWPVGNQPSN